MLRNFFFLVILKCHGLLVVKTEYVAVSMKGRTLEGKGGVIVFLAVPQVTEDRLQRLTDLLDDRDDDDNLVSEIFILGTRLFLLLKYMNFTDLSKLSFFTRRRISDAISLHNFALSSSLYVNSSKRLFITDFTI